MTNELRFERHLPALLEDLYLGPSPDYRNEVLAAAVRTRQRPAWAFPGRWIPMDITTRTIPVTRLPWRQLGVLALIALLLAVALAVAVGSSRRVPAPFGPARNGLIPFVANGDLYAGDPATGKTRVLLSGPATDAAPGFSPDGTRLAFFRDVPGPPAAAAPAPIDIYVMREDGTDVTRITSSPLDKVVSAVWTPDGQRLAVIHPVDGVNRLESFDVGGARPPQLLTAAANADSLAFRPPDGREILFRALVRGRYGLFVMDAAGTNVRTLVQPTNTAEVDQDLAAATYSADGSRIFYQRWFPDSIQLWVMNADGTNPHEFVSEPGPGWDGLAAPSPDGRWVAYWHVIEDGRATQRVAVVRADGTGPIIPTGPEMTGTAHWVWSPDSSKILMMPDYTASTSAYLLDPTGGPPTSVAWHSDTDLDWQRLAP